MTISWDNCLKRLKPRPIKGQLIRVVESQEQIATNALVDDLQEQELLEELLENSKPPKAPGSEKLHYLLAAPFRYPPLMYGSRFGLKTQPSLLYGSHQLATAFAETAYYRFLFWSGISSPPPAKLVTQHTIFSANYATRAGLQLQQPPFAQHQARLTHPSDYAATQQLGSVMRDTGVEAFEFTSARDPEQGVNVGLFSPAGLSSRRPLSQRPGLCQTSATEVSFSSMTDGNTYRFEYRLFTEKGAFQTPAIIAPKARTRATP